mmetsp:Transcript_2813/g.6703  ORF Transcript_2813/g.6703 Transcript_2813/m.6703 type:complete len:283 (-) Transcript_2813:452-1300(-)
MRTLPNSRRSGALTQRRNSTSTPKSPVSSRGVTPRAQRASTRGTPCFPSTRRPSQQTPPSLSERRPASSRKGGLPSCLPSLRRTNQLRPESCRRRCLRSLCQQSPNLLGVLLISPHRTSLRLMGTPLTFQRTTAWVDTCASVFVSTPCVPSSMVSQRTAGLFPLRRRLSSLQGMPLGRCGCLHCHISVCSTFTRTTRSDSARTVLPTSQLRRWRAYDRSRTSLCSDQQMATKCLERTSLPLRTLMARASWLSRGRTSRISLGPLQRASHKGRTCFRKRQTSR